MTRNRREMVNFRCNRMREIEREISASLEREERTAPWDLTEQSYRHKLYAERRSLQESYRGLAA